MRDYKYVVSGANKQIVDLRNMFPDVEDQGSYNSCTAFATGALVQYYLSQKKDLVLWKDFKFSEAYQWYFARLKIGSQNKNEGVSLRDCFKVIQQSGFTQKDDWDFKNGAYTYPNVKARIAAAFYKLYLKELPKYYAINDIEEIKNVLSNDRVVVFGISVTESFELLNKNNQVWTTFDGSPLGRHALLVVGYDDKNFLVRNSWGTSWGVNGYAYIPFDIFKTYAFDMWTLL